jgi:cytoskeletal protein CcmA (bactofilin family)
MWSRRGHLASCWATFAALPLMLFWAVALAQQAELGGKVRSGGDVVVRSGETVPNDLYAFGDTVRIEGRVDGDLVAFGSQVDVLGPVAGDVLVGAGTATISGQVDGDVRVGAGQTSIQGQVNEDVLAGTGQLSIPGEGRVGGDLVFGTWRTVIDGTVAGSVLGSTGDYIKRGSIAGTEKVDVDKPAGEPLPTAGRRVFDFLRRYVSILVVGALLLWLTPRALRDSADVVRGRPLPSLGVGVLTVVGVVVLVLGVILVTVLAAVVFGLLGLGFLAGTTIFAGLLVEGIVAFVFFVILAFGAQAAVGMSLGRLALPEDARSFLRGVRRTGARAAGRGGALGHPLGRWMAGVSRGLAGSRRVGPCPASPSPACADRLEPAGPLGPSPGAGPAPRVRGWGGQAEQPSTGWSVRAG